MRNDPRPAATRRLGISQYYGGFKFGSFNINFDFGDILLLFDLPHNVFTHSPMPGEMPPFFYLREDRACLLLLCSIIPSLCSPEALVFRSPRFLFLGWLFPVQVADLLAIATSASLFPVFFLVVLSPSFCLDPKHNFLQ